PRARNTSVHPAAGRRRAPRTPRGCAARPLPAKAYRQGKESPRNPRSLADPSAIASLSHDRRRLVSRTHRAFDGCRKSCLSPVAGKDDIRPTRVRGRSFCILDWRRREGRALFLDDPPRRRLRAEAVNRGDLAPDRLSKVLPRPVDETIGAADGHRDMFRIGEYPLGQAVDDTKDQGLILGGFDAKMRVDDRTELVRSVELGEQLPRDERRHGKNELVVAPELRAAFAKIEADGASVGERDAPRAYRWSSAGSTKHAERPPIATSGRHALPPANRVSRSIAAASNAEPSAGSVFNPASRTGPQRRS